MKLIWNNIGTKADVHAWKKIAPAFSTKGTPVLKMPKNFKILTEKSKVNTFF